jgi:hypothetical protein
MGASLQDSLGGNTRTTVIATISPNKTACDETCSTLKFADRARNIRTHAVINEQVECTFIVPHCSSIAQQRREKRRRSSLGWSTVLITALGSWEKLVPRSQHYMCTWWKYTYMSRVYYRWITQRLAAAMRRGQLSYDAHQTAT